MGPLKGSLNEYKGITFTEKAVKCLGIHIGHDHNECYSKNWTDKIEKIKNILERWKHRNLTFFGKILIIKSLAMSKVIHAMSILTTPDEILKLRSGENLFQLSVEFT